MELWQIMLIALGSLLGALLLVLGISYYYTLTAKRLRRGEAYNFGAKSDEDGAVIVERSEEDSRMMAHGDDVQLRNMLMSQNGGKKGARSRPLSTADIGSPQDFREVNKTYRNTMFASSESQNEPQPLSVTNPMYTQATQGSPNTSEKGDARQEDTAGNGSDFNDADDFLTAYEAQLDVQPIDLPGPSSPSSTPSGLSHSTIYESENDFLEAYEMEVEERKKEVKSGTAIAEFDFIKVLGKGAFGKVLLAEQRTNGLLHAIKVVKKSLVLHYNDVPQAFAEKRTLELGNDHPFLNSLRQSLQTDTRLYYVMEYLPGGDLMYQIHQLPAKRFTEDQARFYAAEIVCALVFLHSRGLIYRDIKLENMMLDAEGHIRLIDFGMVKEGMENGGRTKTYTGTADFMAPEIIKRTYYGIGVDWWALGVLIHQLVLGHSPFHGIDKAALFRAILYTMPSIPTWISPQCSALILLFLTKDASRRLGADWHLQGNDVKAQDFFAETDWEAANNAGLQPPFVPKVRNLRAAENFDLMYKTLEPCVSPDDANDLGSINQELFRGFSFTRTQL